MFAGTFLIRESPRWLFSKGRREEAIRNLSYLRHLPEDHIYIVEEVSQIDSALELQRSTVGLGFVDPFRALRNNKKVLYRFFLGGALFFWQNTSGINAINYYSPTIFKSIGVKGTNASLLTTGIFGVIKTTVTLVWLFFLIDKLGRRLLLMIGAVGGSICLWYVGGYIGRHLNPFFPSLDAYNLQLSPNQPTTLAILSLPLAFQPCSSSTCGLPSTHRRGTELHGCTTR
jgi:hypothetical protein